MRHVMPRGRGDRGRIHPIEDLHVALGVVGSFQASIQHADSKATVLLAVESGVAALAFGRLPSAGPLRNAGYALATGMGVAGVLLILGLAVSGWLLAGTIRPRLTIPKGDNRFGFPNLVAVGPLPLPASVASQRDEAWQLAGVLAQVALSKHRRVQQSMPWLGLSILAAFGWLMLVAGLDTGAAGTG